MRSFIMVRGEIIKRLGNCLTLNDSDLKSEQNQIFLFWKSFQSFSLFAVSSEEARVYSQSVAMMLTELQHKHK